MDNDLMDRWVACAFGVDCETHRAVLEELQQRRDELETGLCKEEADELEAERDAALKALEAERARYAELLRRIEAVAYFAQERAA